MRGLDKVTFVGLPNPLTVPKSAPKQKGRKVMFSRQHYEEIAGIIRNAKRKANNVPEPNSSFRNEAIAGLEIDLVEMFTNDNPRFDAERFWAACEI